MAPIRFRASINSHRGKANQWVQHKKSLKSDYTAKTLSNGRYFPPVIGQQLDMFLDVKEKPKAVTNISAKADVSVKGKVK